MMLIISIIVIVFNFIKSISISFSENDESYRKKYISNKAIEFVISWYLYKYIVDYNKN